MLGAQIGHKLRRFGIGEGFAERGHFLAAVKNLVGDPGRGPLLVLAEIGEHGTLFAANSSFAVAMGAAFHTKERGSGLRGRLVLGAEQSMCRQRRSEKNKQKREEKLNAKGHGNIFASQGTMLPPSKGGDWRVYSAR